MGIDDELEDLRRRIESKNADRHVRRQYLSALIRADQGERAKQLMLDGFLCPMSWDELEETVDPSIRSCQECESEVFVCRSPEDVRFRASRGECVVAPKAALMDYTDQLIQGKDGAHPQSSPCLSGIKESELPDPINSIPIAEPMMGSAPYIPEESHWEGLAPGDGPKAGPEIGRIEGLGD